MCLKRVVSFFILTSYVQLLNILILLITVLLASVHVRSNGSILCYDFHFLSIHRIYIAIECANKFFLAVVSIAIYFFFLIPFCFLCSAGDGD